MRNPKFASIVFASGVALTALLASCQKEENIAVGPPPPGPPSLPEKSFDYFAKHSVKNEIATLGRVLFYDPSLSVNNAVSCGSCHKQEFAFADKVQFNTGFNGAALKRNSPSIQGIVGFRNMSFDGVNQGQGIPTKENQTPALLFWDGRQNNTAEMVLNPIVNHNEMNMPDLAALEKKIASISYYPPLFQKAFGSDVVTRDRIAFALEGFVACLNTDPLKSNVRPFMEGDPRIDPRFIQPGGSNVTAASFTSVVDAGEFLFHNKYNCATCHDPSHQGEYGSVVSPQQMFNIGLDEVYADQGLGAITRKPGDHGLFKVPTLKNISRTAPYMHDGRFKTLSEVLDHYSHGIKGNNNLDPQFRNADGTVRRLNISSAEKQALLAFLNSLRDDDFLTSPMYSDPFVN